MKFNLLIKIKILKHKDFSCFLKTQFVFIMLINVKMSTYAKFRENITLAKISEFTSQYSTCARSGMLHASEAWEP